MSAAVARVVGNAVVAKLTADLSPTPVGNGVAPANPGSPALYCIVDHMDGTVRSDMDQAYTDVRHVIQTRSVGATVDAAQWVQDAVRTSMLDGSWSIAGVDVIHVELEVAGMVARDDDADPTSLFMGFDRFALRLDTRGA